MENKFQLETQELESAFTQSPVATCILKGPTHIIQLANDKALELWGKAYNEVINKPILEAFPQLVEQGFQEILDHIFTTGEHYASNENSLNLTRNGKQETVYINFEYKPIFNKNKEITGIIGVGIDNTAQIQARKKIEEKEEQLRLALAGGALGTFDFYPITDTLIWSAKTKALFGLPPDAEVNYSLYLKALHPQDRETLKAIAEQQKDLQNGGFYEIEYRTIGIEDGQLRWLRSKGIATYNAEGQAIRYTGVIYEITEQKIADQTQQKLNAILDASTEFISLAAPDTSIVYANPAALKKLGWQSIEGRQVMDCVYPADREYAQKILPELLQKDSLAHEIRFWNQQTGEPFWLQWNSTGIKDPQSNELIGLATVSADITERKKVEEALRNSEQQLLSFVESAPFPIGVYVGREMRIKLVNDSIIKVWGKNIDVVGKLYAEVLPELAGTGIYEQLDQVFTTGKPHHSKNQRIDLMVDNVLQSYYFNYSFTPLFDMAGEVYGVMNTAADVTDLNVANKKLEESEKRFRNTVKQAPVGICILKGKDFLVEIANETYLGLVDRKEANFVNRPLFKALPEVQYVVGPLLEGVLNTGIPYYGNEFMVDIQRHGQKETAYFNFAYQPLFEADGSTSGIIVIANEVTQIVESKQKIVEGERQFREFVIQSPIAMTIFRGPDFVIESPNNALLKNIWQRKLEDVENKKLLEVFPELANQKFPKLLESVFKTAAPYKELEAKALINVNNAIKTFYLDFQYAPLFERNGDVAGIMVTVSDVTDKVEARLRVQESEQRLLLANEAAEMGTFDWDLANEIFFQSEKVAQIFGYEQDTPVNHKDLLNVIHPEDKSIRDSAVQESLKNGSLVYEARIIWPDKSVHWIRVFGKVIYNEQQEPQRMYGTVVDITSQKQAQLALEESENKLNIAIEATDLGTFDIHLQHEEINYSPKYLEIYGFEPSDKPNRKDVIDRIHPDDIAGRSIAMELAVKTGTLNHETRAIYRDGSVHWIRVKGKLIYDKDNQPERILGTVREITKEKDATRQLEENEERLNIALDSAELGTWELDLKTHESHLSQKYLEIFGFAGNEKPSHDELLQKVYPEDMDTRNKRMEDAIETGQIDYELRLTPQKDIIKWISVKGKITYDANGQAEKALGTIKDITEQKNSFQALEESEERFKTIANTAPVMIWMSGNDKFSDFFNTSWLNFTGRTATQEAGEGWLQGVHPEDKTRCIDNYTEAFNNKKSFHIEYRLKRYDGIYRWVLDNAVPRYAPNGLFIGFIGACMDIDDEKNFNEKLKQSELLLKTISNASPVGLWMTNKEAQNTFVNATWIEWTGMPIEEQLGKGWMDKVLAEDKKNASDLFWQALSKKEKYSAEFRITRPDGQVRWCLTEGSPYYDINGEFAGYAGSVTDITESKMVEKQLEEKVMARTAELKKSEEINFRMVNEVEDYAIILLSKDGIVENWNKGAEKIKGYTSEEIIGKHFSTFYTAEDQQKNISAKLIQQAIDTGRATEENWRVKKDGTIFWANVVITALHNEQNDIIGFSKVTRDLTQRKIAEQELEEKSDQLEKANHALEKSNSELEQFAYVASHDLQEPLRKIQFFIERIQKAFPKEDDSVTVFFDKVKNSTIRMNTLIKDLLDFSRLSQMNDKFVTVDLNTVLNNIKNDFELLIQQKKAIVKVMDLPIIEAVPLQMQQLFYNLISNALKFSKENEQPYIAILSNKLTAREMQSSFPHLDRRLIYHCITVQDNGIGFDQQYADKVFVIFQRLNDMYSYSGTGIGLALCKKITLNHNGEIFAKSEEGKGSSFYIILPEKKL